MCGDDVSSAEFQWNTFNFGALVYFAGCKVLFAVANRYARSDWHLMKKADRVLPAVLNAIVYVDALSSVSGMTGPNSFVLLVTVVLLALFYRTKVRCGER
jgi:branched-subunit amino acid transport protein AzlD